MFHNVHGIHYWQVILFVPCLCNTVCYLDSSLNPIKKEGQSISLIFLLTHTHCRIGSKTLLWYCRCSKHNSPTKSPVNGSSKDLGRHQGHHHHKHVPRYRMRTASEQDEIRKQTTSILEKTLAVLQLTALAQFGCGSEHFPKNSLKQTKKGNHYGWVSLKVPYALCFQQQTYNSIQS